MEQMQQERRKKGERMDMCKAIRELMEDSRAEGRDAGIHCSLHFFNTEPQGAVVKIILAV